MEVLPNLTSTHDIHGYEYDEDEYYNGITGDFDHLEQTSLQSVVNTAAVTTTTAAPTTASPMLSSLPSELFLQCRQTHPMGVDYDEPTSITTTKLFEIFCDNSFIDKFINKSTTNDMHNKNNSQNSHNHRANSENYLFESIVKRISRYKCDLINAHYNYDNEMSEANYECSYILNNNNDQIVGDDCTNNRSVYSTKIVIDNVINPITEFILNLPRTLFELAG